ncbi:MAG: TauD/TfdA family dioxygenase [Pseudomonadota bacterium]|nr:TauD/TfdA family dioxygenase [Pseudomonadota bacterium]
MKQEMKLEFVPLSPAIGIEVRNLDAGKPVDDEKASNLRRAWAENSILLLRNQDLTEQQQFAYARIYGEVAARVKPPVEKRSYRADPENPMQIVTNAIDNNGKPIGSLGDGEMWFHTDKCYVKKPHRASFLYAVEIPSEGGHTKFASLYNGYERLPEELKKKLVGRKVLQMYDYTKTEPGDLNQPLEDLLHYWQPVFVTNPDTTRKAVYISRLMSRRIEGYSDDESQAIIDAVSDVVEAPDNIYEHVWTPGDIIIWDNLSCLHARTEWPRDQRRTLRRVTIKGEALR